MQDKNRQTKEENREIELGHKAKSFTFRRTKARFPMRYYVLGNQNNAGLFSSGMVLFPFGMHSQYITFTNALFGRSA
jgi:hypothetical protein